MADKSRFVLMTADGALYEGGVEQDIVRAFNAGLKVYDRILDQTFTSYHSWEQAAADRLNKRMRA